MIELRKIAWDNWEECYNLEVKEEQKHFLASSKFSLAQSYVALLNDKLPPMIYAIHNNEIVIGFTMLYHHTPDKNNYGNEECYGILRFMIDRRFQRKGYGKKAFAKTLEFIKTFPQGKASVVYISYNPQNLVAQNLYSSFGFVETGDIIDGETIARLEL